MVQKAVTQRAQRARGVSNISISTVFVDVDRDSTPPLKEVALNDNFKIPE
jgi:hypothetical protein